MKRGLIKTSVLAVVSVALLYYNVAWAVLHCPHQQSHPHEGVFLDSGARATGMSFSSLDHNQEYLDCTGPKYHTEALAGSSTTSELLRHADGVTSHVSPLFLLVHPPRGDAWLNLFNNVASIMPSISLPRYLSLSVLRF